MVPHQARRTATVLQLAEGLGGDALDYGCGWGDVTARLAPQFRSIRGVDIDPARIDFARREYAPIPFAVCPPSGVDLPPASLDVVLSTVVLHFVPDPSDYLRTCHRILKAGGALVITIPNPDSMWMSARRVLGRPTYPTGWGGDRLMEFPGFLASHGFAVEAQAGFYDPPFDRTGQGGSVALSILNAAGHALRIASRVSYAGFRARCVP